MGTNARLRLIQDRFVAGHENSALRRHIDSVPPETPIRDIVDRCRVWESRCQERALPVYTVDEPAYMPADQVMAAVTAPPVGLGDLEALLRRFLPTPPVLTPPPWPIPTEIEMLQECLLSGVPTPTPPPQTGITGMETLLQRLLSGMPVATGSHSQGLDYESVFLLWQTGPRGGQMPQIGDIPVHVTGVVGGEGGRQLQDDVAAERLRAGNDD